MKISCLKFLLRSQDTLFHAKKNHVDLGDILFEILRQDLPRTHNLMLRIIMSDLGAILPGILSKIFFMPRKIMSDLGAKYLV